MIAKKVKKFDCVAEGRKWKQATGRKLATMTREEQDAYLRAGVEELYAGLEAPKRKNAVHAAR